ncbi:MAG: hypothetical protein BGO30_07325 [Bacteroidetes bacterium 41-46]|nr:MAG: hypothetical protein BGO30_07325 [Bacteroidetes bacterium 41-46]
MDIGSAVQALKNGLMVKREGWDEDMFIFRQVPTLVDKVIVPVMTSLPHSVKCEFERRINAVDSPISGIDYSNQIALVQQGNMVTAYSPTIIDLLAEDWDVYGEANP